MRTLFVLLLASLAVSSVSAHASSERSQRHKAFRCVRAYVQKSDDSDRINAASAMISKIFRKESKEVLKICKDLRNLENRSSSDLLKKGLIARFARENRGITNLSQTVAKQFSDPSLLYCKGVRIGARAALALGLSGDVAGMVCTFADYRQRLYIGVGAGVQIGVGAAIVFKAFNNADDNPGEDILAGKVGAFNTYVNSDLALVLGAEYPLFNDDSILYGDDLISGVVETNSVAFGAALLTGGNIEGYVQVAAWDIFF